MNVKEIEKTVNELDKTGADTISKLYFVYIAKDFDGWQDLNEKEKENIINNIYTFWIKTDLNENYIYNLFDILNDIGGLKENANKSYIEVKEILYKYI